LRIGGLDLVRSRNFSKQRGKEDLTRLTAPSSVVDSVVSTEGDRSFDYRQWVLRFLRMTGVKNGMDEARVGSGDLT